MTEQHWIDGFPKCPGCGRRLTMAIQFADRRHYFCNYADCDLRIKDMNECFVVDIQYRFVVGPHTENKKTS